MSIAFQVRAMVLLHLLNITHHTILKSHRNPSPTQLKIPTQAPIPRQHLCLQRHLQWVTNLHRRLRTHSRVVTRDSSTQPTLNNNNTLQRLSPATLATLQLPLNTRPPTLFTSKKRRKAKAKETWLSVSIQI